MTGAIHVEWKVGDTSIAAEVPIGQTLMDAAVNNNVPGIRGDCGGVLACATCHVFVEKSPVELLVSSDTEAEMLEFAESAPGPTSRLSCQIRASAELEGLTLRVPA